MASGSRLWIPILLSVLMVLLSQNPYVSYEEKNEIAPIDVQEMDFSSPALNISSQYYPETFIDKVSFFDSFRAESVTSGFYHTCVVYDDQSMSCTGYNNYGSLGVGNTPSPYIEKKHIKVDFPEGVKIVKAVAGYYTTCAIDTEDHLWCWGQNDKGQTGTGILESNLYYPEKVLIDSNETIVDVAIGYKHKCALTLSQEIYCWGNNNINQLHFSKNEVSDKKEPTRIAIPDGIKPVSISSKTDHSCILSDNGAVYCWGDNQFGQLGDGSETDRDTMVQVLLPFSDPAISVKVGSYHSCALLMSGDLRCWGHNTVGQIGTGSSTPSEYSYPTSVVDLPIEPIDFDLGEYHTCALLKTQTIFCWGKNNFGQIGDGTTVAKLSPTNVDLNYNGNEFYNPTSIQVGFATNCGIFESGRVGCWGYNAVGQIGDGSTSSRSSVSHNQITIGDESTSLIFPQSKPLRKSPYVDGINFSVSISPQLPNGFSLDSETGAISHDGTGILATTHHNLTLIADVDQVVLPITIVVRDTLPYPGRIGSYLGGITISADNSISDITSLSSTKDHVCLNQKNGQMLCWGDGLNGKLGTASTSAQSIPTPTSSYSAYKEIKDTYSVVTATSHTCSLTNSGEVYCWGEGDDSRLGQSSTTDSTSPIKVSFPEHRPVKMIATHDAHNCAITDDGNIHCWGKNIDGQIGEGSQSNWFGNPTKVTGLGDVMASAISVGDGFSCAVFDNGSIFCWGKNDFGQLGDGTNTNSTQPVLQTLISQQAVTISSGQSHSCAILVTGQVTCWGRNNVGQLGDNTLTDRSTPVIALLPPSKDAVMIDVGISHTCAIMSDGSMYCWGLNANGQLLDGTTTFQRVPVQSQLPSGKTAVIVAAGEGHTCVLTDDSMIYCLGANSDGQLGDSTTIDKFNLVETHWNQNNSISAVYYASGYSLNKQLLVSGWGLFNFSSTQLPTGVTFDNQLGIIRYDGSHNIGQNQLSFSVNNGVSSKTISLTIDVVEFNNLEGRIDSFAYSAGFGPSDSKDAISINVGYYLGCLITYENRMKCWGYNPYGQVGVGHGSTVTSPSFVNDNSMKSSKSMDVGIFHACSIDNESKLWCWGYNNVGQLGDGGVSLKNVPHPVSELSNDVLQVSTGAYHTCALNVEWNVYCWGSNSYGQSGSSSSTSQRLPYRVEGLGPSRPTMVSTGSDIACVLLDNGTIGCFGRADYGQMGDGSTTETYNEIRWPTFPQGRTAISLDLGDQHACAILDDFSLYCWGYNNVGQVGNGSTTNVLIPTQILDSTYQVVGVTTSSLISSTCAWLRNGSALCWGTGTSGQLGNGSLVSSNSPEWVKEHTLNSDLKIVYMNADGYNTCAQYDNGALSCWGGGSYYSLGDATQTGRNQPTTFVYPSTEYSGSEPLNNNIDFVEGFAQQKTLQFSGWNADVSLTGSLPSGLTFNSTSNVLSYDGSNFAAGSFNLQISDEFGSNSISFQYRVVKISSQEGRIANPWLVNGSTNPSYDKPQISVLDTGSTNSCIVESQGDMRCWGVGSSGQLGSGTTSYNYPKRYSNAYGYVDLNFTEVTSGTSHSCGLDSENKLLCWGGRAYYRLADGATTGTRNSPYKYPSSSEVYDTPLAAITAGDYHTCTIRMDVTTWCWGYNNVGQLGYGAVSTQEMPKQVEFPNNLIPLQISSGGGKFTCSLMDDGSVYCWGLNDNGQLGLGNTTDQYLPTKVLLPPGRTALAISAGTSHACAILDDKSIKCWGNNDYGQIGDGTTDDRTSPSSVILSGINDPIQISAGYDSTCALFDDGSIQCWGNNVNGQLGIGSTTQSNSPQSLSSISHLQASSIDVGNNYACALFHDGAPRCWGLGTSGQLGTGSTVSSNSPQLVKGYEEGINQSIIISQGSESSIPIHIAGWDYTSSVFGTLPTGIGWNNMTNSLELTNLLTVGNYSVSITFSIGSYSIVVTADFEIIERIDQWSDRVSSHTHGMAMIDDMESHIPVDLDVGNGYLCYISLTNLNYCQGANSNGQLGDTSSSAKTTPSEIYGFEQPLKSISTGVRHTCGIDYDGSLYCWGANDQGELGQGNTGTSANPYRAEVTVENNGLENNRALQVSVGNDHTCSIFDDLQLYCWGYNYYGQLGIGSTTQQTRSQVVNMPDNLRVTDISLGSSHTCAIVNNGSVYCWGRGDSGQLGDNSTINSQVPVYTQLPQGRTAIAISSGATHSCAILDNNSIYCWGKNNYGQLGIGSTPSYSLLPVFVDMPTSSVPVQLSLGTDFTCTVLNNGSAYCWGYNSHNQVEGPVDNVQPSSITSPLYLNLETNYKIISVSSGGGNTACAIIENGEITCWGSTSSGKAIVLNEENNPNQLRYVISEEYSKRVYPMGWGINSYSISNLPNGITYTEPVLKISSNASQSGIFDWNVDTLDGFNQGSKTYQGVNIDRKQGAKPAWTNSIAYADSGSELPMFSVDANYDHTCGIKQGGELFCWGNNDDGKLGDGTTTRRLRPTAVRFDGETPAVIQVSTGYSNTCLVTEKSRVMCWGDGSKGQNGIGSYSNDLTLFDELRPKEVLLPWSSNATMVSTAYNFACALMDDGSVMCWGTNANGELGVGSSFAYSSLPLEVKLPIGRFALSIDAFHRHTCAVLDDGSMYCWGNRNYGNMGTGSPSNNVGINTPESVELPSGKEVSLMAVGYYHSCAVMTDDTLWCWGKNANGEIGDGTFVQRNLPVQIDVQYYSPIVALSTGDESTCSLHDDGTLNCWGRNDLGQVGDGLSNDQSSPTTIQLEGGKDATWISLGNDYSCATASDGSAQCWGANDYGKLGDGSTEQRSSAGRIDMDLPSTASVLTYLEGEITQNENYVSGWNYTFSVSPPLPQGFELDMNTGTIYSTGNSTFGVSRHNVSAIAGSYTAIVEVTLAVIRDTDGDGIPDSEDYDDDDDGHLDSLDNCPSQAGTSSLGGYIGCPDSDGDGWADLIDPFDNDMTQWKDTDGDGYGDNPNGTTPDIWILDSSQWYDNDGDGFGDNEFGTRGDSCPTIEGYSTIDRYGCLDSDSDGRSDYGDLFPLNTSQWADRDGDGWGDNQSEGAELIDIFPSDGTQWADSDEDGHGDNRYGIEGDWFPNDPDRWADSDRDGTADEDDAFVNDATQSKDRDGDLYGDDPLGNRADEFPDDPTEWKDTDGDGIGNNADAFPFDPTQTTDRDGDGYGDNPLGSGADLFPDNPTQWEDDDEDGLGDNLTGTSADPYLNDFDNDGYNDSIDVLPSFYSPGDLDNDGVLDEFDWAPADYREWADYDGDGKGDNEDPDDDNDGYADTDEIRQKTDPYDSSIVPIESFEIVIPGTSVGLGAWDLIGMFGGIPLFSWIMFGFVTRNKRCRKFETRLNESRSRDELEQVALGWEYSLMLRLLGPHQGIRLERLRAELDDHFEKDETSFEYMNEDQTQLVEKAIPEIRQTIQTEYNVPPAPTINQTSIQQQPTYSQPDLPVSPQKPNSSMVGAVGNDGYEWISHNGYNYYRSANSGSEWTLWSE
jgi:alpha-tubulin suppressor-like RCC1 family protein